MRRAAWFVHFDNLAHDGETSCEAEKVGRASSEAVSHRDKSIVIFGMVNVLEWSRKLALLQTSGGRDRYRERRGVIFVVFRDGSHLSRYHLVISLLIFFQTLEEQPFRKMR
jgi:hypothetical protein